MIRRGAEYIQTERPRQVLDGIRQLDSIPCANSQGTFRPSPFQGVISGNVIGVAMRVQNGCRCAIQRLQLLDDRLVLETRIENQTIVPAFKIGNIGVLSEHAVHDDFQVHDVVAHKIVSLGIHAGYTIRPTVEG